MHSLKRSRAAATAAILLMTAGAALARPDTLTLTCAQVQQLVEQNGSVQMSTGPNIYDHYVTPYFRCDYPYEPTPASVETADTKQCPVYNCERGMEIFERD